MTEYFTTDLLLCVSLCGAGCTIDQAEKYTFKKLMERDLREQCGDNIKCKEVVSDQIDHCLDYANWKILLDAEEDAPEIIEFYKKFSGCFRYEGGDPVFSSRLPAGQQRAQATPRSNKIPL